LLGIKNLLPHTVWHIISAHGCRERYSHYGGMGQLSIISARDRSYVVRLLEYYRTVVPASYRVAYSRTYNTVARLGPRGRRRRRCAEPCEFPPCLHDDANLCGDDGGLGTHKWPISRSGWKLGVARPTILALAPRNGSARRGSIACTRWTRFHFHLCYVVVVVGGGVIIHFGAAGYE